MGSCSGVTRENCNFVPCPGEFLLRNWSFKAIVSFEGYVDDKYGTLKMSVVGTRPDGLADWQGKSVILSGTGELANLRGQGTWWGPGAPAPEVWGDIYYAGNYHFEP